MYVQYIVFLLCFPYYIDHLCPQIFTDSFYTIMPIINVFVLFINDHRYGLCISGVKSLDLMLFFNLKLETCHSLKAVCITMEKNMENLPKYIVLSSNFGG